MKKKEPRCQKLIFAFRQPGCLGVRPVAFRPCFATSLALSDLSKLYHACCFASRKKTMSFTTDRTKTIVAERFSQIKNIRKLLFSVCRSSDIFPIAAYLEDEWCDSDIVQEQVKLAPGKALLNRTWNRSGRQ